MAVTRADQARRPPPGVHFARPPDVLAGEQSTAGRRLARPGGVTGYSSPCDSSSTSRSPSGGAPRGAASCSERSPTTVRRHCSGLPASRTALSSRRCSHDRSRWSTTSVMEHVTPAGLVQPLHVGRRSSARDYASAQTQRGWVDPRERGPPWPSVRSMVAMQRAADDSAGSASDPPGRASTWRGDRE